ncbi:TPA: hypothetical protein QEM72_002707 [Pseudomonas putida]|uniref:hypothetical protein n=1 Tax=Pseudomonas putida TaxID=303 RepID=UPI0023642DC7|nr:hypothetical protein [Pseudomonas putida]MDD2076443.1 hypothetical protein [Pseudomonas putida]HDS1692203.1 hypothetical protein [Pseudomonas putida]
MAVTAPVITLLPDPPLPTDAPAVFDTKAGASLLAQQAMVPEINLSLSWVETQTNVTEGYKNAAAGSATAAASSASAANTAKLAAQQAVADAAAAGAAQVNLAAQQVTLAKAQADLSKQHADSSQAYAAAAQSAVGAPSLAGNAYKVLGVNGNATGVAWTWGLPNTALATRGQAVIWGNGQPVWGFPDRIGDVVMSANDPGSLYLPCDGTVRLKAPFPLLAAKLGSLGGKTGSDFVTQATSVTTGTCVGIAVAPNPTVGGKPYVLQVFSNGDASMSIDGGATWRTLTALKSALSGSSRTPLSVTYDPKNKKWIIPLSALSGADLQYVEMGLDGNSAGSMTGFGGYAAGSAFSKIVCDKNGTWIGLLTTTSRYVYRATNGGSSGNSSWSQIDATQTTVWVDLDTDDQGTWVVVGNVYSVISRDGGLTFKAASANATSGGYVFVVTDKKGNWLTGGNSGGTTFKRSADNGLNFFLSGSPVGSQLGATAAYSDGFFFFTTGGSIHSTSSDLAVASFGQSAYNIMPVTNISGMFKVAALDGWVFGSINVSPATVVKSIPTYAYDTVSQFALPYVTAPLGLNCYIRALEA